MLSTRKINQINVKISTNMGANWGTAYTYDLKNTGCNELKAIFAQNSIHIVWSELRSGSSNIYDAHYVEFKFYNYSWNNYQSITDEELNGGDFPRIAVSTDKLYVIYKSAPLLLYGREKNLSGSWGSVESIPILPLEDGEGSFTAFIRYHNIHATNDRFSVIYRIDIYDISEESSWIAQCYKLYNNGSWILNENYVITSAPGTHVQSTISKDDTINVLGWDENNTGYYHWKIGGSIWILNGTSPTLYFSSSLSCGSKDLYLYKIPDSGILYLKYQKYDDYPLTPSITGSIYRTDYNAHPYIYWDQYIEPDVAANTSDGITIERILDSGSPTNIYITGTSSNYIDWSVNYAGSGPAHAYYKIRAKDSGGKSSLAWSNTADIRYGEAWKAGINNSTHEFNLNQNYPNPFNPVTNITYSIPEVSEVQVIIFDLLGREVAILVNGSIPAGSHTIKWDASEFPSGMYIYRITAVTKDSKTFTTNKQMLLVK